MCCDYCGSSNIVETLEGSTCTDCSREQNQPNYVTPHNVRSYSDFNESASHSKLLEVCFRENLPVPMADAANKRYLKIKCVSRLIKYSTNKLLCYSLLSKINEFDCFRPIQAICNYFEGVIFTDVCAITKILNKSGNNILSMNVNNENAVDYYCSMIGILSSPIRNKIVDNTNKVEAILSCNRNTLIAISLCNYLYLETNQNMQPVYIILKKISCVCNVSFGTLKKYMKYIINKL